MGKLKTIKSRAYIKENPDVNLGIIMGCKNYYYGIF